MLLHISNSGDVISSLSISSVPVLYPTQFSLIAKIVQNSAFLFSGSFIQPARAVVPPPRLRTTHDGSGWVLGDILKGAEACGTLRLCSIR